MSAGWKKMTGKGVMVTLVAVSLILAGIGSAAAGRHDLGEGWQKGDMGKQQHRRCGLGIWKNPKRVEELELTDDQIAQLKDSDFAGREKQLELKAQLEGYRLEMEKAFFATNLDEDAVRELAGKIAGVKGDLFVQKVESRLTLTKILTADQIEQLKEKAVSQRNRKHQRGEHKGQGRSAGNGQGRMLPDAGDCVYNAKN